MGRIAVVLGLAAALSAFALPAVAQQEVRDREELDRAAGRLVFRNDPIAEADPFPRQADPARRAAPAAAGRRAVRVILASPYGR